MNSNGNGHVAYLKPVFHPTRDIRHLTWWQMLLWPVFVEVLRLGFRLGLPVLIDRNGARLEVDAIAETDSIASAIVASIGPEAFYVPNVPKNVRLPKSNVIFGGQRAPYSPIAELYETAGKHEIAVVCPLTRGLCTNHETIPIEDVENLYNRIKTAVAS